MGFDSPFDLLGLFRGVGLAQGGAALMTGQFPNMVWLYRRPILDYWAEHEETLGSLVTHVLVHEIGHHFGLSDADMEAIEAAADESRAENAYPGGSPSPRRCSCSATNQPSDAQAAPPHQPASTSDGQCTPR